MRRQLIPVVIKSVFPEFSFASIALLFPVILVSISAVPALAADFLEGKPPLHIARLESCQVGQRVITPGGKPATVTAVQGSGCKVRQDGVSYEDTYSAFMLDAVAGSGDASAKPVSAQAVSTGKYQCYFLIGSTLNYSLVDVNILSASRYADKYGNKGKYRQNGKDIVFESGTFEKHRAYTRNGNIMLSSPTGSNYMSCSKQRGS
ncbi:hypothetical protein [Methylobacillus flagellatus]|uniref:hypothetical protein n=1 Tax=Methylobacillus flagellatus TaxID=405 RepID=UPI0010F81D96|nr:hypothetical protein [Methylobacillus flagellatus]